MQDYKLSFNKIYLFISLLICAHEVHGHSYLKKNVYSVDAKENVPFAKVLAASNLKLLFVDENCSVCEHVMKKLQSRDLERYILGVVNNPSFTWLAKKKRQGIRNVIYNISNLEVNLKEGTPQLLAFSKDGKIIKQIYGRSKILKAIQP